MKLQNPNEINQQLYSRYKVHQPIASPQEMNEATLQFYKQNGFVAVNQVIEPAEVQQAIEALMQHVFDPDTKTTVQFSKPVKEIRSPEERENAVRKVALFIGKDEVLTSLSQHPKLVEIVEKLLGEESRLVQDMALLKPPRGGGEKPWHQDMAYGNLAYDKAVIGVWIALDEAEIENGCMHVIPRSHMQGAIPHYAERDWQLCDTMVPVERDVVVPLKPGGALFFHGLLMHGTPFNQSEKRRRAIQLHYAPRSAEKLSPKEYKRFFTNEMTDAEC